MARSLLYVVLGGLLTCAVSVSAAQPGRWTGSAELGAVATTGNTRTRNITARSRIETQRARWHHIVTAEVLSSSEKNATTAERYFLSGKSDFKLDEKSYVFALLSYENDRFSGFDHRWMETLGYGRSIIDRKALSLKLEAGLGARQSKISDTGQTRNEGIVHFGGNLSWNISDSATLTQDLFTDIGSQSTVSKAVTSLSTRIVGNLASKLAFTARHTSNVPAGFKKLDTETTVTLVYNF